MGLWNDINNKLKKVEEFIEKELNDDALEARAKRAIKDAKKEADRLVNGDASNKAHGMLAKGGEIAGKAAEAVGWDRGAEVADKFHKKHDVKAQSNVLMKLYKKIEHLFKDLVKKINAMCSKHGVDGADITKGLEKFAKDVGKQAKELSAKGKVNKYHRKKEERRQVRDETREKYGIQK